MIPVALQLFLLLILALVFGRLAWRPPLHQPWLERSAVRGALGLMALLGVLLGSLAGVGLYRFHNPPLAGPPEDVTLPLSDTLLARGERLAHLCASCHASAGRLPLAGGAENITPGIGRLYAPNLTPGGPIRAWTDDELARAIRAGVHRSGRSLLIMPSGDYRHLSDRDLAAIIAYLRSQPTEERVVPTTQLNLLGAMVIGAGVFPLSAEEAVPAPGPSTASLTGVTPDYGRYLTRIAGCQTCHGENLEGGTDEYVPIGPALPLMLSQWGPEGFVKTMRTGENPYGRHLDPKLMPWPDYAGAFTDEELPAIYTFIQDLDKEVAQHSQETTPRAEER